MASLSLKHIFKVYSGGVKAVNDFSMDIKDHEFIVFVGPSGCGKSTTLRMIAGLEDITAGELRIDGEIVNDYEPKDRNIAMVFQNYALYPHMTVYENMAFSLRTAHVPNEIIYEKVTNAASILGITQYLDRKPKALSGGQRQRVSLGRAIVRNPKVFLLDEPLSIVEIILPASNHVKTCALYHVTYPTYSTIKVEACQVFLFIEKSTLARVPAVEQVRNEICPYGQMKSLRGEIFAPQM